jgi:hypothetical protein
MRHDVAVLSKQIVDIVEHDPYQYSRLGWSPESLL